MFKTYSDGTAAKLGKGVLAAASTRNGECTTTGDVGGNLLAVADGRRASGVLVLKSAVATVVDGAGYGSKTDNEGSGCELHDE